MIVLRIHHTLFVMTDTTKKIKKSTVLRTRCSLEELAAIMDKFEQSGLNSLSEYLRSSAMQNKIVVKQSNADFELLQELKCSGNNLNQLAKLFHSTGQEPIELRETLSTHELVLKKIFGSL